MHRRTDTDHARHFKAPVAAASFLAGLTGFVLAGPAEAATCGDGHCDLQLNGGETAYNCPQDCITGIQIPTVHFTPTSSTTENGRTTIVVPYLAQYISGIYQYAWYAAVVVAGVMMVIGGAEWLTAGDSGRVKHAQERIVNAVIGLGLVLGLYAILSTVSPNLTRLDGLTINVVSGIPLPAEAIEDYGDTTAAPTDNSATATEPGVAPPQAYCKDVASCKTACADFKAGKLPTFIPGMLDPAAAQVIPDGPGLRGNGIKASGSVITHLQQAAAIAQTYNPKLTISVASGYRPFADQMQLVCDRIDSGDQVRIDGIGHAVAWPGGSNHGAGSAVDIQLIDSSTGKAIVGSGSCAREAAGTLATATDSGTFDHIMFLAGFRRYQKELWHYEFGGPQSACRCDASHPCPTFPVSCSQACN